MSTPMAVRVTVLDHWDQVTLATSAETPVAEVKRRALEVARVAGLPGDYLVKYLGAEVHDEGSSLASAGVVANGALIVLRRQRQPTR